MTFHAINLSVGGNAEFTAGRHCGPNSANSQHDFFTLPIRKETNMNRQLLNTVLATMVAAFAVQFGIATPTRAADSRSQVDAKAYLLEKAPQRAAEVAATRKDATDQQDVVVVGRVGGRKSPWVKNAAAFSIVDRSLKACSERPGDTCSTPWDFCCEADLPKSTLLVLVQDADGRIIKKDARELLGLKELDTVFVQGKAKRDKTGNVSILASKFYIAGGKNSKKNAATETKGAAK
jgi:hypothetical protein